MGFGFCFSTASMFRHRLPLEFHSWWSSLNQLCRASLQRHFLELKKKMAEGSIKKLTDKGFGFIDTSSGQDLFFHTSALQGVSFEQLYEGQQVSFTEGRGQKGPCAENVTPV